MVEGAARVGLPSSGCATRLAHPGAAIRPRNCRFASIVPALFLALLGATDCGSPESQPPETAIDGPIDLGARYADDAAFRRDALVHSLTNPENAYSRLRLERYTEDRWGALGEWNPHVAPITVTSSDPPDATSAAWTALDVDGVEWEERALVELGRKAFFGYPTQLAPFLQAVLGDQVRASSYGVGANGDSVLGSVWTELPGGVIEPALACAACHSTVDAGAVVPGKNNADFDIAKLIADYGQGGPGTWGPGRVDVTNDGIDNPTAITDLRAVRSQVALHHAATVKNELVALAIRIETLIITSLDEAVRPPRKLAFAMALYLWELEPEPMHGPDTASQRGETVFGDNCSSCHKPPSFSGPSVPIAVVGTDPSVGMSPDRTTGFYRVPSLRGVGDRRRLFANGAVEDIEELLRSDRTAKGHTFGLGLGDSDKADLVRYLETL